MNMTGVNYYLNCEEVHDELKTRIDRIADKANALAHEHGFGDRSNKPAYEAEVDTHRRIAAAHVWANAAGQLDLAEHTTLTQALDAGR